MTKLVTRVNDFINFPPKKIEKRRHAEYFGIFLSCVSSVLVNSVGLLAFFLESMPLVMLPILSAMLMWTMSGYFARRGKFSAAVYLSLANMGINVAIITWITGTEYGVPMILWTTIAMATLNTSKKPWLTIAAGLLVVLELVLIYAFFPEQSSIYPSTGNAPIFFLLMSVMTGAALMFVLLRLKSIQITQSKRLQKQIYNDELTGLYNRHFVYELLDYELEMMKKTRSPFCLCFADVDHFKKVNDTYGHQVGDEVLKGIADVLTNSLRKSDVICRWGGEEFVIVLPRCDIAQAPQVIEKVKQALNEKVISSRQLAVTMSFGIVSLSNDEPIELILKRADDLLYLAKENGRNRIEVETDLVNKA